MFAWASLLASMIDYKLYKVWVRKYAAAAYAASRATIENYLFIIRSVSFINMNFIKFISFNDFLV